MEAALLFPLYIDMDSYNQSHDADENGVNPPLYEAILLEAVLFWDS